VGVESGDEKATSRDLQVGCEMEEVVLFGITAGWKLDGNYRIRGRFPLPSRKN